MSLSENEGFRRQDAKYQATREKFVLIRTIRGFFRWSKDKQ
jgi:hypothetical protein